MSLARCKFPSARAKSAALADFMRRYGDDLPEAVIKKATAVDTLGLWTALCDERGVAAAAHHERNDWYLCTLKNAAVRPDLRGRGIGRDLYRRITDRALADPACLVLAADITYDNVPSIRALRRAGFATVNRFCWQRGQKPANILHFVRLPPRGKSCP